MKKLQNNFTTQEQSKRLLELGLPADSADCIIKNNKHVYKYNFDMEPTMTQLIERLNTDDCINVYNPCWSVGRLIEIYHICVSRCFSFNVCFPNLMNEIMYKLGEANCNGWLDLKKLDE